MIETAGAFLVENEKVLLGLRSAHKSSPGCWDIFGGHLEAGETARTALFRELREELGLLVSDATPMVSLSLDDSSDEVFRLHVFLVTKWIGQPSVCGEEHSEIKWFSLKSARALINLAASEYRGLFEQLAGAVGPGDAAAVP